MQSNLMVFMTMVLGIVHIQTFAPNQILVSLNSFQIKVYTSPWCYCILLRKGFAYISLEVS